MHWLRLHLVAVLIASVLADKDVCHKQPFEAFLPLSKLTQAESFCTSKFPLVPCLTKITKASTATVTKVVDTTTVTEQSTSEVVARLIRSTITSTETLVSNARTVTITITPSPTTVTVFTATSVSVLFTSNLVRRQDPIERRQIREQIQKDGVQIPLPPITHTTVAPTTPALLKSLHAQAGNFISTVCSCIQESQECTTKVFSISTTVTNEVTATAMIYDLTVTRSITSTILHTTVTTATEDVVATIKSQITDLSAVSTETTSLALTTTKYCPASCTPGTTIGACMPHNFHAKLECTTFNIECNSAISVDEIPARIIPFGSHGECMRACDFLEGCNVFTYDEGRGMCTMYREVDTARPQTFGATGMSIGWRATQAKCASS